MSRVYLYKRYERLWHWAAGRPHPGPGRHGLRGPWGLARPGFESSVRLHEAFGLGLVALTMFTMFWHWTTGEVRQFIPTRKNFVDQVRFYTTGIFRSAPHPEIATPEKKFNPIQKAAYFGLLIFVFPVQIAAGLLYLGAPLWPGLIDALGGLRARRPHPHRGGFRHAELPGGPPLHDHDGRDARVESSVHAHRLGRALIAEA